MGKIFCILGKSGSGKDTLFKKLIEDRQLGLKRVVTYTTRPVREGETDGVEYHFISDKELNHLKNAGKIIELRQYETVRGVWTYCTVDDGQIDLAAGNYLMIVTPESFQSLAEFFGKTSVVPFCINVEDGLRLTRAIKREKTGGRPDYSEMCRRFLADEKDFSMEKLKKCGIQKFYDNTSLERCIALLKSKILKLK